LHNRLLFIYVTSAVCGTALLSVVEFALHPQHETSCDPEIQTKEETLEC